MVWLETAKHEAHRGLDREMSHAALLSVSRRIIEICPARRRIVAIMAEQYRFVVGGESARRNVHSSGELWQARMASYTLFTTEARVTPDEARRRSLSMTLTCSDTSSRPIRKKRELCGATEAAWRKS